MMRNTFILFLSYIFLAISCSDSNTTKPQGTYYGILPCADCPGINYELTFEDDTAYTVKMVYQGKNDNVFSHQGNYTVDKNQVVQLQGKTYSGMDQFKFKKDTLVMLDSSGNQIEGELNENYQLTREKPVGFSLTTNDQDETFDFKATGNEPFWMLKIDFEELMVFTSIDSNTFDIKIPVAEPVKSQDGDTVIYNASAESGSLQVTILQEKCTDSMSGMEFGYKVHVNAKTSENDEFINFEGCGEYLGE